MSTGNWQKIKLIKIIEILQQNTDEEHPMTTLELCQHVLDAGIRCERRTLAEDIKVLNDYGYEVMSGTKGHAKTYYIADRKFDRHELKILIDAVQAASFITNKKTDELVNKIADLGGKHRAQVLMNHIAYFNTTKHSNESIYYNIDTIEQAIQKQKQISFLYFDLDVGGTRVYRKEKQWYIVNPVALIFTNDNYYLVAINDKYQNLHNYRVDRMEAVSIENEDITDLPSLKDQNLAQYRETAFHMFVGQTEFVKLEFTDEVKNAIFDKFGETTKITRAKDNKFVATVQVQVSPTFFGWVFQFGRKMKILSPKDVAEEYKSLVDEVI
jgi:predicted DNA-binding transcriptional regulator YafY